MGSWRDRSLYDWAHEGFGAIITCACGYSVTIPAAELLQRMKKPGNAAHGAWEHRLRCRRCRRRGHATVRCTAEPR